MPGFDVNSMIAAATTYGPVAVIALGLIVSGHLRFTLSIGKKKNDK